MNSSFRNRLEIVTDTMGVDLCPYLTDVFKAVRMNWLQRIPEDARPPQVKRGDLAIDFETLKDGSVDGMRFAGPSGDVALAQAAWDAIKASAPFPSLPAQFPERDVTLRIHFSYNPAKPDKAVSSDKQEKEGTGCGATDADEPVVFEAGPGMTPPIPTYAPLPVYPKGARAALEQGAVTVGIVVEPDGSVRNARIVKGLGPELDKEALEAVRSWRFEPATKDGRPIAAHVNVVVNFKLY